ncbi:hypothetical protein ACE1TI_15275 [Alteribacillus sp. JSM 102045]|uniref:hypothetical protein n=1 Tax=Alteribacillus sp. JSM 102045 TaxID=1562101 RepID=UPI0035C23473
MIIKKREMPLSLKKLEALERRLPKKRPTVEVLARQMAGFKGELAIDFSLSFLPSEHYWFIHHKRKPLPIEALVVMANERTIVRHASAASASFSEKIIPCGRIPKYIINIEQTYIKAHYSERELESLSELLLKQHQELDNDILKQFQIDRSEIISGVQCQVCSRYAMEWDRRRWQCPYCRFRMLNAHAKALEDYSLLFSPTLSNRDARKFLHLTSPNYTKHILQRCSKSFIGKTREKKYLLR